jgi:hypothetical protein
MTFRVHINDSTYAVADADLAELESRILEAVHAGGAFIDLDGRSGEQVRAMVSPATRVRMEKLPPPAESPADGGEHQDLAFIDLMDV